MKQVTFSTQSLNVIGGLSKLEQLDLVEKLTSLSGEIYSEKFPGIGKFYRKGKTYYRIRLNSSRIYLEKNDVSLHCQFILPKNSLQDFLVRCKIPASDEAIIKNHQNFWDFLEKLRR